MTIDKAIEILSQDLTYTYPACYDDLQDAINLGKEALIFYQTQQTRVIPSYTVLLPGEDPP